MAWSVEGRYFENCPCDVPCPCTVSLALGADTERCTPVLVFHIDAGEVDGVDVSGLNVVAVADTPRGMSEGGWRLGVVIDEAASDEQAGKLLAEVLLVGLMEAARVPRQAPRAEPQQVALAGLLVALAAAAWMLSDNRMA